MNKKENANFKYTPNEENATKISELCDEIDKFGTSFPFVVGLLEKIPYELAMYIISNLKHNKEMYDGTLKSMYYDDFKKDIKNKEENKKTKFENRQKLIDISNYKEYVYERLLTIGEVDTLIKCFIDEGKIKVSFEDIISEKVKVEDKYIPTLLKARKFLSSESVVKSSEKLIEKMEKFWIDLTYKLLLKHKENNQTNTQ